MKLAALIEGLGVERTGNAATDTDPDITTITEDSRQVTPGSLFVARQGLTHDGTRFIDDAVAAGAVAVLSCDIQPAAANVVNLIADDLPLIAAKLAERLCGNPSSQLKLIGITGTNGKTTTAHLVHHMLNAAGIRCGMIGTVQVDDGSPMHTQTHGPQLTTPPALQLSPLIRRMVDSGCEACVMEASSHALVQKRTAGLDFDIAVFTNISGDHLDYHESMEQYIQAKAILFQSLPEHGTAVVNSDDDAAPAMIRATQGTVLTCSLAHGNAQCSARIAEATITHVQAQFAGPWGECDFKLPLCGRHNVMNALQCAAVGHAMGLDGAAIAQTLSNCTAPPGRLEPVTDAGEPFAVYVDYAHTDDALRNVLAALKPLVPHGGQLRVVFGCGGDRDRTKRPRMAQAACAFGDAVVITSDNPRTEDPQTIVNEVASGVPANMADRCTCIVDRRDAINAAVSQAQPGDVVLIAGKGHETYQIIGTAYTAFDDRVVAAEALSTRRSHAV